MKQQRRIIQVKSKKRLALPYVPFMIIIACITIWLAQKHDAKVLTTNVEAVRFDFGPYEGDILEDESQAGFIIQETEEYNGSDVEDNGRQYCIKVNKEQNVVTIYTADQDGIYNIPVKAMICSVGADDGTPAGVFSIQSKSEWLALKGDVYGQYASRIVGNILFHSVPYYSKNKGDLEVEEYNKLGERASLGCVRLAVIDAKWIYDHCEIGTQVEIFESAYKGPLGKPVAATLASKGTFGNWDPTDPDRDNPYMEPTPFIFGAYDRKLQKGEPFNLLSGISSIDWQGNDITAQVKVEGEVKKNACGEYPITYSVRDDSGKEASITAYFTIEDSIPPILRVTENFTKINAVNMRNSKSLKELLLQNAEAEDMGEPLPKENILVDYSALHGQTVGEYKIKYCAVDDAGNRSNIQSITVWIDIEAPVISLKDKNNLFILRKYIRDEEYLKNLVTVEDNFGEVELFVSVPMTDHPDMDYIVVYYAKDAFGNISDLSIPFKIKDY